MVDEVSPKTEAPHAFRRAFTGEEPAQLRHQQQNRSPPSIEPPISGIRRKSSNLSDFSNEARKTLKTSTHELLLPTPTGEEQQHHESSHWDSAPLAFALLPALGGLLFKNGSSVITDIMLLGLAAVFLNWSVRIPWDWYHSPQSIRKASIRKAEEYMGEAIVADESEEDNDLSLSQTLDDVPEEDEEAAPRQPVPKPLRQTSPREAATKELYTHEILALTACFLFPLLGAYLLHTIRSQLTRPSEGLVSNYNLTIFLLASEIRPLAHVAKLIRARTSHLERVVVANCIATDTPHAQPSNNNKDLRRRLEDLEARSSIAEPVAGTTSEPALNGKQTAIITTEVRRTLQPELDALNRAVRRYEKRATLQAFQTESRLQDLEGRLNDAISLAAAAANNGAQNGVTGIICEWIAKGMVLPLKMLGALASLPFKTIAALVNAGKVKMLGQKQQGVQGRGGKGQRRHIHGRAGDRVPGRIGKR